MGRNFKLALITKALRFSLLSIIAVLCVAASMQVSDFETRAPVAHASFSYDYLDVANVLVNTDSSQLPQNETIIALHPTNPDIMALGANDYRHGASRAAVYWSLDRGANWQSQVIPGYPASVYPKGDPALAYSSEGELYFASVARPLDANVDRCQSDGGVYAARSVDNGVTWGPPVQVAANAGPAPYSYVADKEFIAVDNSGGTYDGRVYVSYTQFIYEGGCKDTYVASPILVASLSPDASTVLQTVRIGGDSDTYSHGSIPVVDNQGNLYVSYQTTDDACPITSTQLNASALPVFQQQAIHIVKSSDGGATFGNPVRVACQFALPREQGQWSRLISTEFRVNGFPSMAVNPVSGHIYLTWAEWTANEASNVYVSASQDGGMTWSTPVRANDDTPGLLRDQFFPWISVAPDGSRVDVVFNDRRDDPNNIKYHTYLASSYDGAQSFSANLRLSTVESDPANDGFGGLFIGDYIGVASENGYVHATWTDTRNGNADAYYARAIPSPNAGPAPLTYGITWGSSTLGSSLGTGETAPVQVTLTNSGSKTWSAGTFYVSYHVHDSGGAYVGTGGWTPLTSDVANGQSVTANVTVVAPLTAGDYTVRWDVIDMGIPSWLSAL